MYYLRGGYSRPVWAEHWIPVKLLLSYTVHILFQYRFEIEREDMEKDRMLINTMEDRERKQKELEQQARCVLINYN